MVAASCPNGVTLASDCSRLHVLRVVPNAEDGTNCRFATTVRHATAMCPRHDDRFHRADEWIPGGLTRADAHEVSDG